VIIEACVNVDSFPLPWSMGLLSEHVYDNDDEFSDFVFPPPPPPPSWRSLHPATKAPLDMYVCNILDVRTKLRFWTMPMSFSCS
jgi:hypothetical protein